VKRLIYPIFGLMVLGGYGLMTYRGVDPFATGTDERVAPPAVVAAPAAAAAFWYGAGLHGGK